VKTASGVNEENEEASSCLETLPGRFIFTSSYDIS
jgi:hypothetical protein